MTVNVLLEDKTLGSSADNRVVAGKDFQRLCSLGFLPLEGPHSVRINLISAHRTRHILALFNMNLSPSESNLLGPSGKGGHRLGWLVTGLIPLLQQSREGGEGWEERLGFCLVVGSGATLFYLRGSQDKKNLGNGRRTHVMYSCQKHGMMFWANFFYWPQCGPVKQRIFSFENLFCDIITVIEVLVRQNQIVL